MPKKPRPERLEDVEITPEARALFERAVDAALRTPRPPKAKSTGAGPVGKKRGGGARAKVS